MLSLRSFFVLLALAGLALAQPQVSGPQYPESVTFRGFFIPFFGDLPLGAADIRVPSWVDLYSNTQGSTPFQISRMYSGMDGKNLRMASAVICDKASGNGTSYYLTCPKGGSCDCLAFKHPDCDIAVPTIPPPSEATYGQTFFGYSGVTEYKWQYGEQDDISVRMFTTNNDQNIVGMGVKQPSFNPNVTEPLEYLIITQNWVLGPPNINPNDIPLECSNPGVAPSSMKKRMMMNPTMNAFQALLNLF